MEKKGEARPQWCAGRGMRVRSQMGDKTMTQALSRGGSRALLLVGCATHAPLGRWVFDGSRAEYRRTAECDRQGAST